MSKALKNRQNYFTEINFNEFVNVIYTMFNIRELL